jgi:hypothetical protein
MNHDVASLSSCPKPICNRETRITRIRWPERLLPPFEDKRVEWAQPSQLAPISSKGQAPRIPHSWLKIYGSPT